MKTSIKNPVTEFQLNGLSSANDQVRLLFTSTFVMELKFWIELVDGICRSVRNFNEYKIEVKAF